jgi:3-isopropylmalate/(R)-2-methylmalate dehydratase small subunit
MGIIVTGKVWKFGDEVSTDSIIPAFALSLPWDERKKQMLLVHETFNSSCRPGDVIVARKNFGCGSAREEAPESLTRLGVGCVVAESFGRLFFRNCISTGFPVMACKGVSEIFSEGDTLELNLEEARMRNITTGKEIKGPTLPPDLLAIMESGGILEQLKAEKRQTT